MKQNIRKGRGRRINIGDNLIFLGPTSVKYGTVTHNNIYKSTDRRGQNIFVDDDNGCRISFNWKLFDFSNK